MRTVVRAREGMNVWERWAWGYTLWEVHKAHRYAGDALWLTARAARMIHWMLREAWYRPLPALVVAASMLVTIGLSPNAGLLALVTLSSGYLFYRVWIFARLPGATAPDILSHWSSLAVILYSLVRLVWRCWRLRRRWPATARVLGLTRHDTRLTPRLRAMTYHGPHAASCVISLAGIGPTPEQLAGEPMTKLAIQLRLRSATCVPVTGKSGLLRLTFHWKLRIDNVQPLTALPEPKPGWAMYGIGEDDQPVGVRLGVSTLIVGESRSGKSSTVWAMVCSTLEQARARWRRGHVRRFLFWRWKPKPVRVPAGEPVEFWVIDQSQTEFAAIQPSAARYAKNQHDALQLLEDLWAVAVKRAAMMGEDSIRVHKPTEEHPRIILVVDEMLFLVSRKLDPKEGKAAEGKLFKILTQAAKYAIVVWCNTQAGKISVVGDNRDFFQQRVCHSAGSKFMTDAALGDQANSQGANCHQLQIPRDAGKGWVRDYELTGYRQFRSVWVPDEDVLSIGRGELPDRLLAARGEPTKAQMKPGAVYEFWSPKRRRLLRTRRECLYVGLTEQDNPATRWRRHLSGSTAKEWAGEVDQVRVKTFPTFEDADRVEKNRIHKLRPRYNEIRYDERKGRTHV